MGMAGLWIQVRNAILTSGQTRYRIAQETGISEAQLSRLMSGQRGLSVEVLELLVEYLGLEIVIRPKRRRTKKGQVNR